MAFVREGRHSESGFTLIELMLVVAIVAILAAVVVPSFMSKATKAKRKTEVAAMFAEIASKQESFKLEKSFYLGLTSGTNYVGTTTCPTSVPTADYNFQTSCGIAGSAWAMLRVNPTESAIRCQYSITTGLAGTAFTPPTGFKNSQNQLNTAEAAMASGWFYLVAVCDEVASTSANATYYTSSVDRRIQAINEGT
jgi:prepilin-type N-terminal cleavage/methylation domain-containing protein